MEEHNKSVSNREISTFREEKTDLCYHASRVIGETGTTLHCTGELELWATTESSGGRMQQPLVCSYIRSVGRNLYLGSVLLSYIKWWDWFCCYGGGGGVGGGGSAVVVVGIAVSTTPESHTVPRCNAMSDLQPSRVKYSNNKAAVFRGGGSRSG